MEMWNSRMAPSHFREAAGGSAGCFQARPTPQPALTAFFLCCMLKHSELRLAFKVKPELIARVDLAPAQRNY
jgi:hypothetical protein